VIPPETLDRRLGTISHLSPLRAKLRRLGIGDASCLLALAVERGCRHYRPYVEAIEAKAPPVPRAQLGDEEVCIALILGSWNYDPVMIRAAAQLLAGASIRVELLARLAVQERCETVLGYLAGCGERTEPANPFWKRLLEKLPPFPPACPGALPHPSRFRSETGIVNPRRPDTPRVQWLRPAPQTT
jgi:hypothetical protein